MSRTVTILTDRPAFASRWQTALSAHDLATSVRVSSELALALDDCEAIVVDGAAADLDRDGILAIVGCARAAGLVAALHETPDMLGANPLDVFVELTSGLVSTRDDEIERVAGAIARRIDRGRARRFERVTKSPRESEILAVLGDGRALLARRPVTAEDDGSEILSITLSEDASSAVLELESGLHVLVSTGDVVPSEIPSINSVQSLQIDGARLGKRLRTLRLEAGLTQADLARRTGIHRPNIARVEAGRHTPSLETLTRLASAIGVPTTRVLSDD